MLGISTALGTTGTANHAGRAIAAPTARHTGRTTRRRARVATLVTVVRAWTLLALATSLALSAPRIAAAQAGDGAASEQAGGGEAEAKPKVDPATLYAKASPAAKALCVDQRGDAMEWCVSGCATWPSETACKMVRVYGPLGINVAIHARNNKLDVREVAKQAGQTEEWGRRLRLYADHENIVRVDWNRSGEPSEAVAQKLAQAQAMTVEAVKAFRARNLLEAERGFVAALATVRAQRGGKHVDTAACLVRLGHAQMALGNLTGAKTSFSEALAIQRAAMDDDHPAVADAMVMLGQLAHKELRFAEARALFEGAIERRGKTHGGDDSEVALYNNNLAFVCGELADFACQRKALETALTLRKLHYGPNSEQVATELSNLGTFELRMGNMAKAQTMLEEALRLRRQPGWPARDLAISLNNVAGMHKQMGAYGTARKLLEEALRVWDRDPKTDPLERAVSMSMLGMVLVDAGDMEAGLILLRKVVTLREKLSPLHPDRILSIRTLGAVLLSIAGHLMAGKERDDLVREGVQMVEAAANATLALRGKDHPDVLEMVIVLANARSTQKKYDEAEKYFLVAIEGLSKRFGHEHSLLIAAWNNLGVCRVDQGKYAEALEAYYKGLAIASAALGEWHPTTQTIRVNIHSVSLRMGTTTALLDSGDRLVAALVDRVEAAIPAAATDLELLTLLGGLDAAREAALALAGTELDQGRVYGAALRLTGLPQRAESVWRALRRADGAATTEAEALLERYRQGARERLALEGASGELQLTAAQRRDQRARVDAEMAQVERSLAKTLPGLAELRRLLRPGLQELCATLAKQKAALVHFVPARRAGGDGSFLEDYAAFVVDGRCKVSAQRLGRSKEIDAEVTAWRDAMTAMTACFTKRRKAQFCAKEAATLDELGAKLRTRIWAPNEAALGKASRVWIVATESLLAVSFDALPDAKGRYLVHDRAIGYLPHPAALLASQAKVAASTAALVVGDVDFEQAAPSIRDAAKVWRHCDAKGCAEPDVGGETQVAMADTGAATRAGSSICGQDARWMALPTTEAADVAQELGKLVGEATWMVGAGATEASVVAAMEGARVLHFATHGYFAPASACAEIKQSKDEVERLLNRRIEDVRREPLIDPMRLSAIVLSGRNADRSSPGDRDGVLTARDIARLNLRKADLAVLSACETGLGENGNADGAIGLGRSLIVAGVGSVVASLWQVPSAQTAELFRDFYGRLKGGKGQLALGSIAVVDALRASRLALIASLEKQGVPRSAFLWGAFVPVAGRP